MGERPRAATRPRRQARGLTPGRRAARRSGEGGPAARRPGGRLASGLGARPRPGSRERAPPTPPPPGEAGEGISRRSAGQGPPRRPRTLGRCGSARGESVGQGFTRSAGMARGGGDGRPRKGRGSAGHGPRRGDRKLEASTPASDVRPRMAQVPPRTSRGAADDPGISRRPEQISPVQGLGAREVSSTPAAVSPPERSGREGPCPASHAIGMVAAKREEHWAAADPGTTNQATDARSVAAQHLIDRDRIASRIEPPTPDAPSRPAPRPDLTRNPGAPVPVGPEVTAPAI